LFTAADAEPRARQRAVWASGDYSSMVDMWLRPLGARLVEACDIHAGTTVLDVACGTGNAALPAARAGADVVAVDLTPELMDVGRQCARAAELSLVWVEADAEELPFFDDSFDVVVSSIGAMFAPHHDAVADELVRVCRPGGTIGLLSWTPGGLMGALLRILAPFAPPPRGPDLPPRWGSAAHLERLFGTRVVFTTCKREALDVTEFTTARAFADHFRARHGPTIAARLNAARVGREAQLDGVIDALFEEWNRGESDDARFALEYLVTVARRA